MKATLTFTQRINLHTLVGTLPARDVKGIRLAWNVMDKLDLSAEEKQAINYRLVQLDPEGSQFVPRWDDRATTPTKEFQFNQAEVAFLRQALEIAAAQGSLLPGPQRAWLEPLLDTFISKEE